MELTKRKIVSLTGIRSDYAVISPVYQAIKNNPNLSLELVVSGAHLSPEFGLSVKEIESDGFFIADTVESLLSSNTLSSRAKGTAIILSGLIQSLDRIKPDLLLVLGDREEALATAIAGTYLNLPVAHIAGGDTSFGNNDDTIRHAVTKLSHIHLVTNHHSQEILLKLGEDPSLIFNVGNPALDRTINLPSLSLQELSQELEIDLSTRPLVCLLQHPVSTEINDSYQNMKSILDAITELDYNTIIIHPNSDAGSRDIIKAINKYLPKNPKLKAVANLPSLKFVNLLRHSDCLVGNSSAGILEAPSLHLPVVNVGTRQAGRLHANNVIFTKYNTEEIKSAIQKSCLDQNYRQQVATCSNPYGDGTAGKKIADILSQVNLKNILVKKLNY